MEQAEEWITGRHYLDISLLEKRKETKTINQSSQIWTSSLHLKGFTLE